MRVKNILGDFLLVVTAAILLVLAIFAVREQLGFVTITSNSMAPTMHAGDSAFTTQVSRNEIRRGDILILPHPSDPDVYFAHRVISLDRSENRVLIETQGDANPVKDDWVLELRSEEVPRVRLTLSTSGLPLDISQRKLFSQTMLGIALVAIFMGARKRRAETKIDT